MKLLKFSDLLKQARLWKWIGYSKRDRWMLLDGMIYANRIIRERNIERGK